MRRLIFWMSALLFVFWATGCRRAGPVSMPIFMLEEKSLIPSELIKTRMHYARLPEGYEHYKCLVHASDGKIYYILATKQADMAAQMYCYDPAARKVEHLADMDEVTGQKGTNAYPQGKSHVDFYEHEGKLYTGLTSGFMVPAADIGQLPGSEGYKPYPGGHFIAYDLKTGRFEDLARAPEGEGIITMGMDKARGRLYGLTSPGGMFVYYDLARRQFKNLGDRFSSGCRTLAIDPRSGDVYWGTADGRIAVYRYGQDKMERYGRCDFRDKAFGAKPGTWRSILWYEPEKRFYGISGPGAVLFTFEPDAGLIVPIESITAEPARLRINDQVESKAFSGGLGFNLGPDGHTIYYMATGPALRLDGGGEIDRTVHFVSYHIPSRAYRDHGKLRLANGRYPLYAQSVEHGDGMVYAVAWIHVPDGDSARGRAIRQSGRQKTDGPLYEINLISFSDPLAGK